MASPTMAAPPEARATARTTNSRGPVSADANSVSYVRSVDKEARDRLTPRMERRRTVLKVGEAGEVGAINLVGEAFRAKRATKFDSVLDPAEDVWLDARAREADGRERWPVNVTMAPVKVDDLTLDDQARLLRNGIRGLLQESFGLLNDSWPTVESALDSLSGLSQESVQTAIRTLQDELLPTLRGLKPAPRTPLRETLDRLEEDCNAASRSDDDAGAGKLTPAFASSSSSTTIFAR